METPEEKSLLKEPDITSGRHTYADYLTWEMEEMVELIKGKVFRKAAAAPRRIHQKLAGNLHTELNLFLKGKKCEAYIAPFDVRLPVSSKKDDKVHTVVQPDICVICDPEKLDERGCIGAPDLVVEVLSPGNKQLELQHKYEVYEESGVKEYWLLDPEGQTLLIYTLKVGKYEASRLMTSGDIAKSSAIPVFELDLEEFFREIK
ncbi:Endonuclease, Uma2 family (restriction endonuclease fold) [Aquiflexum balticum DSM 16537]|uniref:Endonuclease, Uma2 family (Restriction endonuclease fold) n=1 Tax=Aquiflexum balticum DSM 16537 TaxID=758820 RepID=A0A1W2HB54_9BACT|nr:Uma2 family endonuclease [Aquiflexum balticum]SMD46103.1 Endonuclease, Uma2 family (restriction endonuclease fold) [Aquiflexum balticum DSM 16537]